MQFQACFGTCDPILDLVLARVNRHCLWRKHGVKKGKTPDLVRRSMNKPVAICDKIGESHEGDTVSTGYQKAGDAQGQHRVFGI